MLAEASPSAEKVWLGSDDEDLQKLLRDLQQVRLPDHPRQAWARLQILNHIKNCINAIELDHIKVLKQIEKGDPYGVDNAADWLAQSMHLRPNAAYAKVCTACELEEFPNLYRRVHEGELSPEATTVILQTLRRVRRHLTPEHVDAVEREMLHAAQEMDHAQLRAHGSRVFHLFNREAHNEVLYEERERRFFDLKRRVDGWFTCSGELDPEGGTFLQVALKAIAAEDKRTLPSDDHRTPGQARADALVELAEHRLAFGDLPQHGQEKPHLTIVASAETLRGEDGSPAPQIDWGTPVSGETAKRIACDAIARIAVVGNRGDGVVDVLHMGRAFRTTSVAQRKALDLQDGGCIWCGRYVKDCRPHHWEAWSQGGATDHENLGLVCPRHHFALHEGGYRTAEVTPDRVVILRPDGTEWATVPRHRWRRIPIGGGSG